MSQGGVRVELAPAAQRQLRRLPPGDSARLRGPILALSIDPRPHGVANVSDSELWRLRVGDLRIVYAIDNREHMVVVLTVARRSESAYRRAEPAIGHVLVIPSTGTPLDVAAVRELIDADRYGS